MLRYDYQYDVVAVIVAFCMLWLICIRARFFSKSTKIFMAIMSCVFLASLMDLISIFTISNPEKYPLWFNYMVSLGYLLFCNESSTLYFWYIDSKGKVGKIRDISRAIVIGTTIFYVVSIFTSPFTHAVAYFDKDLVYCHGPLFTVLYAIPYLLFAMEVYIFHAAKNRFSRYQIRTGSLLVLGMAVSLGLQILNERLLVMQCMMSIILFFVYEAYENPAYYTDGETRCLNAKAFGYFASARFNHEQHGILVVEIADYSNIHAVYPIRVEAKLLSGLAECLEQQFGTSVFHVTTSRFAVVYNKEEGIGTVMEVFDEIRNLYIEAKNVKHRFGFEFYQVECDVSDTQLLLLVEACEENVDEENVGSVISQLMDDRQRKDRYISIIKSALARDGIRVYYQPIYHVPTNSYKSAEALLRVVDPETGWFVDTEELVRIAEQTGYIDEISDVVFHKVCRFIKEMDAKALGLEYIEVNLSPMQCMRKNLVEHLLGIMNEYGVSTSQINLEITETAEMQNRGQIDENVRDLYAAGISLSIDDFGSGFASMNYLIQFPIHIVKIDKIILWAAMKDATAMQVLRHTIHMIQDLGKQIVVEGVEDGEMANLLKQEGCEFNQGYLFSKPISEDEFVDFCKRNN